MDKKAVSSNKRLWTKDLILILSINFFSSVIMNMLNSTMPLYVAHIGGSKSSVGLLTGIFSLSALLFRPLFGNIIDNKSRKLVLLIGVSILSLVSLSYTLISSVVLLLFLRIIHGIGLSAQSTAIGTVISDIVPKSRLSQGVGLSGTAATIATAVGPSLGLYLIGNFNYNIFFYGATLFGILAIAFSLFLNYEKKDNNVKEIRDKKDNIEGGKKKLDLFESSAIPASIVAFFILFTISSLFTFLPSYAKEKNIENIGLFFTVYAISFLVGRTIADRLTHKLGLNKIIIFGLSTVIVSFIILAFSSNLLTILFVGAIYGLGYSVAQPSLNSIAVSNCSPDRRGAANATFFSAMDIGFFIGATIWGILIEKGSFSHVYIGSAICIGLALLSYIFLIVKPSKEKRECERYKTMESM